MSHSQLPRFRDEKDLFLPLSASESLQDLYLLSQDLEEKKCADITKLFLVSTKEGISFVRKRSIKGFWLCFKERVKRIFHVKSSLLDVDSSLKRISSAFDRVLKKEDSFFAERMLNKSHVKISTQDLKEKIKNLKTRIDTLESHVNTKRKKIELRAQSQSPVSDESSLQLEKSLKEIFASQGLYDYKGVFDIINGFQDTLKNQLINSDISLQDRFKIIQDRVDQNSLIGADINIPVDQLVDMTAIACGSLIGIKEKFLARDWVQLLFQCMESKEQYRSTKKGRQFRSLLETMETASEDNLEKRIGGAFYDNRINRKLLTSISGEILYEIERLQNKKFAFRVYNAQALLLAKNPAINSQIEPCYGLVHVSKEILFSSSFFNILAHITTASFEGAIATVLPMLGGERELIPEGVHQELTKDSFSGFITMKSLLARSFNSTDYRLIKFDFQSYLIEKLLIKYHLALETGINARVISLHESLKNSIQSYARLIDRLRKEGIYEERIAEAVFLKNTCENCLARSSLEIEEYRRDQWEIERTIPSEFTAFRDISCPTERLLDRRKIDVITECSHGLSSESARYIHWIRTELKFGSDTFWPQFFQILQTIAQLKTFEAEWIPVLEVAIKQVPDLKSWERASFKDPAASMGWISRLLSKIRTELNEASPPEAFLIYFSLSAYFETAAKSWSKAPEQSFLNASFGSLSLFDAKQKEFFFKMQTSDPYWSRLLRDLSLFIEGKCNPFADIFYKEDTQCYAMDNLPKKVHQLIQSWWGSEVNTELRSRVLKSIDQDREAQKKAIESLSRKWELEKEALILQLKEASTKEAKDSLESKMRSGVYQLKSEIWGVQYGDQYWPHDCEKTELILTSFLFCYGKRPSMIFFRASGNFFVNKGFAQDLIPIELRIYLDRLMGTLAAPYQIDRGLDWNSLHYQYKISSNGKYELSPSVIFQLDQKRLHTGLDQYASTIDPQNKQLASVYQELYRKKERKALAESNVHAVVQQFRREHESTIGPLEQNFLVEFASIWATKEMQLPALLTYFNGKPLKLQEAHWLNFFHAILFDTDILLSCFENPAKRATSFELLKQFFQNRIASAEQLGSISSAANFAWIATQVEEYLSFIYPEGSFNEFQIISDSIWSNLFEKSLLAQHANDQAVVYEALLASSKRLFALDLKNAEDRFIEIYLSYLLLERCAVDVQKEIIPRKKQKESAIKELILFSSPTSLNQSDLADLFTKKGVPYLKKIFPKYNIKSCKHSDIGFIFFDQYTKKIGNFSIETGVFEAIEESDLIVCNRPLSSELLHILKEIEIDIPAEKIKTFFWTKVRGIIYLENRPTSIQIKIAQSKQKKWNVYFKTPSQGNNWGMWINGTGFFANEWIGDFYFWNNQGPLEALPKILRENYYFCYIEAQTRSYFYNKKTYVCEYEANGANISISSPDTPDLRRVGHLAESSIRTIFSSFEELDWVVVLGSHGTMPSEIRLPRFNMAFTNEVVNGAQKWVFAKDRNWMLAAQQFSDHFIAVDSLLFLENSKGEKKILIPTLFDSISSIRRYVEVATKSGSHELVPMTSEAQIYLAYTYLRQNSIEKAEKYLFHYRARVTSRKHTKDEEAVLKAIVIGLGSYTALSFRLRFYALFLIESNDSYFPQEFSNQPDVKYFASSVELAVIYINFLGKVGSIERSRELFVLDRLIQYGEKFKASELTPEIKLQQQTILNRYRLLYGQVTPNSHPSLRFNVLFTYLHLEKFSNFWNLPCDLYGYYPKPTEREKWNYETARQQGHLPFDYRSVTNEEFSQYLRLIHTECLKRVSWGSLKKSPFAMQLLHILLFSDDEKVKNGAGYCLKALFRWNISAAHTIQAFRQEFPRGSISSALALREYPLQRVYEHFQDLSIISTLDPREDFGVTFRELEERLLEKKSEMSSSQKSTLFSSNSIEALSSRYAEKKFQEAQEDLEVAQSKRDALARYSIKSDIDVDGIQVGLENQITEAKTSLNILETEIITALHAALRFLPESDAQFSSGTRVLPLIADLVVIVSSARAEKEIERLFPELSEMGRKVLKGKVEEYLLQKRHIQALQRVLNGISAIEDSKPQVLALSLQNESASYNRSSEIRALVMALEIQLNICIRPDQVEKMEQIIKGGNGAYQMIMGFGKTQVLLALIAILIAGEEECLSTIIVPSQLYPVVQKILASAIGESYAKDVHCSQYDRLKAKNLQYLQAELSALKRAFEKRSIVLRTTQSKQSILASLYELLFIYNSRALTEEEMKCLSLITAILKLSLEKEFSQVDELDSELDPDILFKYSIGDRSSILMNKGLLISEILLEFATSPDIVGAISIDFIDAFQGRVHEKHKKGVPLSAERFHSDVHPVLVKIAQEYLSKKIPTLAAKAIKDGKNYLELFLIQQFSNEKDRTHCHQWFNKANFSPEERELIATASLCISTFFASSFMKECGVNYGPDPDITCAIARPYSAPNAPKRTVFGDQHEQLIYSVQQVLYYGIPRSFIHKMLSTLQKNAQEEAIHIAYKATSSYKKLCHIMGDRAEDLNLLDTQFLESSIEEFHRCVNRNKEALLEYMQTYIFPQTKIFESSITITPLALTETSKKVVGYTGTLHSGILPQGMVSHSEKGTDGATISAIEKKFQNGEGSIKVLSDETGPLLEQLMGNIQDTADNRVFIDSGGWLKDAKMEVFTRELLERFIQSKSDIKGIVYHNQQDELVSLECHQEDGYQIVPLSRSRYSTKAETLYTIIAQKYAIGTDIPQSDTAHAIMTMRKGMNMPSFVQSIFRMRQILGEQSISFIMSLEVKEHIAAAIINRLLSTNSIEETRARGGYPQDIQEALRKSSGSDKKSFVNSFLINFQPSIESIMRYCLANQTEDEMRKNWSSGVHRMRAYIEKALILLLTDETIPLKDRAALLQEIQELVLQETSGNACDRVLAITAERPSKDVRDALVSRHLAMAKIMKDRFKRHDAVKEFGTGFKEKLEACIALHEVSEFQVGSSSEENEVETEQEVELEVEAEKIQEQPLQEQVQDPLVLIWKNLLGSSTVAPFTPDELAGCLFSNQFAALSSHSWSKKFGDISNLRVSPNLKFEGNYHRTGGFIFIAEDLKGKKKYLACHNGDAAQIERAIISHSKEIKYKATLISFDGQMVAATSHASPKSFSLDAHDKEALIMIKLYAGKTDCTPQEMQVLKELEKKKQIDKSSLKAFCLKNIEGRSEAEASFKRTLLSHWFAESN
ncbi:MAG: DUF3638 domain-containing protein [Chlamydia sp.]